MSTLGLAAAARALLQEPGLLRVRTDRRRQLLSQSGSVGLVRTVVLHGGSVRPLGVLRRAVLWRVTACVTHVS